MTPNTLYHKLSQRIELTNSERYSLYKLLASGTRQRNRDRLYRRIMVHGCEFCCLYGIYERVYFENEEAHYCAGQSYPDEIRTLRECILE